MRFPITFLGLAALAAVMSGCASVQRGTPTVGAQVMLNMARTDYTVLGTVTGTSTEQSFALGIVKIIDGDKYSILGFKDFEDQYAFTTTEAAALARIPVIGALLGGPTVYDRAYFKALAATPDADGVTPKSVACTTSGVPLINVKRVVTYTGKAVKFRAD